MKVVIEESPAFSVLAVSRVCSGENAMAEIPEFWREYDARGYGEFACGQYGVCYGMTPDGTFRYAIGNRCTPESRADGSTVYHIFNRPDRTEIPDRFELLSVPAGTWAKFECLGPLPRSIQEMWPRICKEWLPDSGYEKVPGFDIEEYGMCHTPEDAQKPDYRCFIRIPVRRKPPEYQIRPMTIGDYETVHELWRQTSGVGLRQVDDSKAGIAAFLKRNPATCFVAVHSTGLIGVIMAGHDGRRGYLYHTAVRKEFQRRGIGSALLNSALEALDREGIRKAALVVFADNLPGNRFWERAGFTARPDLIYRNRELSSPGETR